MLFRKVALCNMLSRSVQAALYLPRLVCDLDPEYNIDASSSVASWGSRVGTLVATESDSNKRPTIGGYHGRRIITFNGTQSLITSAVSLGTFTFVTVFAGTSAGMVYEKTGPRTWLYGNNSSTIVAVGTGQSAYSVTNPAAWCSDGTWRVIVHRMGGTNATQSLLFNGVAPTMTNGTTGNPGVGVVSSTITLMSRAESSLFATGSIGRLLIYDRALTDDEARIVTAALRCQWQI
jgi:hypothetical protein